jgi:hypothetical protein
MGGLLELDPAVMDQDEPTEVYQQLLEAGRLSVRVRPYYADDREKRVRE